jgi:hypothetical protein
MTTHYRWETTTSSGLPGTGCASARRLARCGEHDHSHDTEDREEAAALRPGTGRAPPTGQESTSSMTLVTKLTRLPTLKRSTFAIAAAVFTAGW